MSLLCLISSSGFQLHSVKSEHLTTQSCLCPCTSLSFPAHYIWPQAYLSFSNRTGFPVLGLHPCCPFAWNAQPLLIQVFAESTSWAYNLKCPLPQPCCSLLHLPILFSPQHVSLLKINMFIYWFIYFFSVSPLQYVPLLTCGQDNAQCDWLN